MKILSKYILILGALVAAFTNFIACGAQMYSVSLDGDHSTTAASEVNSSDPSSQFFGLHAPRGWVSLPIKYNIDPTMSETQLKGLQRAMATWETAVGKQLFQLIGKHKDTTGDSFPDLMSSLNDPFNGQYIDHNWKKNNKSNWVIATTIWSNDQGTNDIISTSDIHYNEEDYFISDALSESPRDKREIVDMQSIAIHELGHLLGLAHISVDYDSSSIMNPSMMIGQGLASRSISTGDIQRIQKIYGCEGSACDIQTTARTIMQSMYKDSQAAKPSSEGGEQGH